MMDTRHTVYPWKWIGGATILLILITGVPYLYAWLNTPPGSVYTGLHALTPGDFNVYFAQIRQAVEGTLSTHNLFSGKEGVGSISMANPLWWLLGRASAIFHIAPPLMFHIVRLLLIPCALIVLWQLIVLMLPTYTRKIAAVTILFSSGIGYLLLPFLPPEAERGGVYAWPTDLWVPESNTFLTLYHSPHLLLALILFLGVLVCFLRAHRTTHPFPWQIIGGLAAAALFLFHPFHVLTLASVLGLWTLLIGRESSRVSFQTLMIFLFISAPSIGWQIGRMFTDEITLDWARQNITPTPPLWALVAGGGLLLPYAMIGFKSLSTRTKEHHLYRRTPLLLATWLLVHLILAFSPVPFQRRLLQGVHVPLAMLAGEGIIVGMHLLRRTPLLFSTFATVILWISLVSSTVGTISRDLALFSSQDPHFYLSSGMRKVFRVLGQNSRDDVVLAGQITASFVPAWAGRAVYAAPGAHSVYYDVAGRVRTYWFLLGRGTRDQRTQFLQHERISDVVIGPLDGIDVASLIRDPLLTLLSHQEGVYHFIVAAHRDL